MAHGLPRAAQGATPPPQDSREWPEGSPCSVDGSVVEHLLVLITLIKNNP